MATSKVHPALKAVEKNGAQKVKVAVSDIDGAGTPLISAMTTPPSRDGNMAFQMLWLA
ncbi:MAG: hypothetical protein RL770_952 [Pseudomonadota bacterium]